MRYVGWIAVVLAWLSVADAAPLGWPRFIETVLSQPQPSRPNRPGRQSPRPATNADDGKGTTDAAAVKAFWEQADIVLAGMKGRAVTAPIIESDAGKVVAIVDKAAVGLFYDELGPTRYLAFHLRVGNTRKQPLSWQREVITATLDGAPRTVDEIKSPLVNHGFQTGGDHVRLEQCQPPAVLQLPAEGVTGMWVVFSNIPVGGALPKVTIRLPLEKAALAIDTAESQRALLRLQVERLGPRGSLALVTIGGMLNTYNLFGIADELDELVADKVSRVVIQWTPSAPSPDGQILSWLQQSAMFHGNNGRGVNEQLPTLNSALKELHLVQLKNGGFSVGLYRGQSGAAKVHRSAAEAVSAALMSGVLTLSREELLEQIQKGHPLARAAALRHGAPQLGQADVPLLVQYTRDEDATIRAAALEALGDFASVPEVLTQLETVARRGEDAEATAAVRALVGSRFTTGRQTIEGWLTGPDANLRKRVLAVLADQPRSEWGDALFAHAHDSDGRLRVEVLRALVPLDHPKLVELLEEALKSPDKSLRDFVFPILAHRTDERSENLASRYALSAIEQLPPDSAMVEFLSRTKDQRALPALLRHLDAAPDRAGLINLLGQIGDRRTGDYLAQKFAQFKSHEQSAVLHALRTLRHEKFPELAATALMSTDGSLLSSATQGLLHDGSNAAVEALVRGLEKQTQPYAISMICNALAGIGTPAARQALLKQRGAKEPARRNAGMQGLQNLQMRSPGYTYIHQARAHRVNRQDDDAFEMYTLAIQIDPELADAYAGRGEMQLKREKWTDAGADLAKAAELDPYNGLACSGWAIALVMQGRYEDGVRTVEGARERLTGDVNYAYNAACVYGRLVEATLKQPESTERETRLKQYRQQAISDLAASVKLGFRDFKWMREDPDLKPLHDLKEFQDIVRGGEEKKEE